MNVEAQAIDVPTGAQDYRPALLRRHLGGRARRQWRPPRAIDVRARRAAAAARARLHQRVAQFRHQQLGRHEAAYRRRHRRAAQLRAHPRHRRRDARGARAARLGGGRPPDRRRVGEPQAARARRDHAGDRRDARRRRATPARSAARSAAPAAAAACSASATPADIPAIRQALHEAGARVLDFTIEARGLVIDTF